MSALVSIIIPVYNLEKYIKHCLESVVNQTYKELEIICIDDGSTDGSAEIIKSMAANDPRIKYIYQENAGVSAARNKGLDTATGEYVMFVDGDDYIHYQMVDAFAIEAQKNGADVVLSNLKNVRDYYFNFEKYDFYSSSIVKLEDLYYKFKCGYSVIGNMISRSLIDKVRFFTDISIGEDGCFMMMVCPKAKKLLLMDQYYYFYFFRENSATNSLYSYGKSSVIDAGDRQFEIAKQLDNNVLKAIVLEGIYKSIFENRNLCKGTKCEKDVKRKCKVIGNKHFFDLLHCRGISFKKRFAFVLCFKIPILYNAFRIILDPTMIKIYKRKKIKND